MHNSAPRVLIVEDGYMIAMEIKAVVEACGCSTVGPVATVGKALEAARQTDLDGAVLDINLADERVWPVAELLEHQGVPFVLSTGYGTAEIPHRFRGYQALAKPVAARALRDALVRIGLVEP